MDMNVLKFNILNELEHSQPVFHRLPNNQYRIRCPICGDSQKNERDSHCYIKCDLNSDSPMVYNCFLCSGGGRVTSYFLKRLGISNKQFEALDKFVYRKIPMIKDVEMEVVSGVPHIDTPQVKYIEYRLGEGFTLEDYAKFKIIWDMTFLLKHASDRKWNVRSLPIDSISFLSDDKSLVINREYRDNGAWRKVKLYDSDHRAVYTIATMVDLFTDGTITINIAEGIVDILSVYKNFNTGDNSTYIAILGSDYIEGVLYGINKGMVGKNVNVNIYIDWNIDEKSLREGLKRYKWIFGTIRILKNIKYKDVGVHIEKIKLAEVKV